MFEVVPDVAFALSIYKSDNIFFIEEAINSILTQDYNKWHLFIAVDGPVCEQVATYLDELEHHNKISVFFYGVNKGLATRLNDLIEQILTEDSFKYIARMDADDVCNRSRLTKQVRAMESSPEIDVIGSDVIEIDSDGKEIFYKKMTSNHKELVDQIIKKCPFNHPTVIMKTSIFKSGLRYNSELKNTQDYYLWVDLIKAGYIFANINEPLLKFRVDSNFHQRRGLKKAINDFNARAYAFKNLGCYNFGNIIHSVLLFILRISPSFIKKIAYKNLR